MDIPAESEPEPASEPGVETEPETQKETSVVIIEPEVAEISDPIVDPVEPFNWRLYLKIGLALFAGLVILTAYGHSVSEKHASESIYRAVKSGLTEPESQAASVEEVETQAQEISEPQREELPVPESDPVIAADPVGEDRSPADESDQSNPMLESQALKAAKRYLDFKSFSHDGLIGQLEFEGFSTEEATAAADQCGADWNEQALKSALNYLEHQSFSYKGLIEQLEFEGYTSEQAEYGADKCEADWNEQAAKKAADYLDHQSFSRDGLVEQLEFEGFTPEQAAYGVGEVYE